MYKRQDPVQTIVRGDSVGVKRRRSLDDGVPNKKKKETEETKEESKGETADDGKDSKEEKEISSEPSESSSEEPQQNDTRASLIQTEQAEIDRIQQLRLKLQQKQVDMWDLYQHGLKHVTKLSDLAHAPDAILPGNFG